MKKKLITEEDRNQAITSLVKITLTEGWWFELTKRRKVRTVSQNRLERLWLACISFETGNDANELHDYFKEKWIEPKEVIIFEEKKMVYSTRNLNTVQFKYFLDKIQAFVSTELGITLPVPEDKAWDSFYETYRDKL
jgi:CTP:phosphocholine cytidylyltransferase-like protein